VCRERQVPLLHSGAVTAADVVRRYWDELWGGADLAIVDELFAEPYTRHNRNGTEVLSRARLKDDFGRYWRSLGTAVEVRIDDLVESGDRVWTRVTIWGTDRESGDRRAVTFMQEARVADGRLAESWSLTAPDVDWRPKRET